jgi:hypothetical protein
VHLAVCIGVRVHKVSKVAKQLLAAAEELGTSFERFQTLRESKSTTRGIAQVRQRRGGTTQKMALPFTREPRQHTHRAKPPR